MKTFLACFFFFVCESLWEEFCNIGSQNEVKLEKRENSLPEEKNDLSWKQMLSPARRDPNAGA